MGMYYYLYSPSIVLYVGSFFLSFFFATIKNILTDVISDYFLRINSPKRNDRD